MNGARTVHIRIIDGPPCNQFPRQIVDDFRVPLHLRACRRFYHPMRALRIDDLHVLQMRHEARKVLQPPPEGIDLGHRLFDGDRLVDRCCCTWTGIEVRDVIVGCPLLEFLGQIAVGFVWFFSQKLSRAIGKTSHLVVANATGLRLTGIVFHR